MSNHLFILSEHVVEIIRGQLQLTQSLPECVLTIGNFDGFHKGHQRLVEQLKAEGRRLRCPTVVITFEPQPREFFNPHHKFPRLMRFQEKCAIFAEKKIDYLVCLHFNKKLAELPAESFVEDILIKQLDVKSIVVGDDFAFGAKRIGNFALLSALGKKYNFTVTAMPSFLLEDRRVSSTWVREAVLANHFQLAKQLLGRPYFLCGKIIHGDARGREWGFPTANIALNDKVVCVAGIYAVLVQGLSPANILGVASVGVGRCFRVEVFY